MVLRLHFLDIFSFFLCVCFIIYSFFLTYLYTFVLTSPTCGPEAPSTTLQVSKDSWKKPYKVMYTV